MVDIPPHVYNSLVMAADRLSCEIEAIVVKAFIYFSHDTAGKEKLKGLCEIVDIIYQNVS